MGRRLERYPEYKDSGLPWLGLIPAHWEIQRNGRLFSQRNENGFPDLPILEVSLKTGVRVRGLDNQKRKQMMADRAKYKRAVRGDIAYNMMRLWQGAVGVAPVDGLVSPAYVVAKPHPGTNSRYYAYLLRTAAYMNEVNKYSHGIVTDRNRLYWDEFKQMPSVFPPPDEQAAIANCLDHHGALVSRYVRNKRRLIELLKEQKKAVIQQAVTRGLDPNVQTKPSGIDWLGDIPAHWEVRPLKRVADVNPPRLESGMVGEDEVAFLPMECVGTDGSISPEIRRIAEVFKGFTHFRRSDVIVAKITPCFENGKGAFLDTLPTEVGFGSTEFHVLRPRPCTYGKFLYYLSLTPHFRRLGAQAMVGAAGQQRVPESFVSSFPVALPPLQEQYEIAAHLDARVLVTGEALACVQREINLIREYRTRLIADVVTGRVDVRSLAPAVTDVPQSIEDITGEAAAAEDEEVLPEEAAEEVAIGNE